MSKVKLFKQQGIPLVTALALSIIAPVAVADKTSSISEARWQAFNMAAVKQHIIPGYQHLAEQSKALSTSLQQLCLQPTDKTLADAKAQYKAASQAWQGIQHVQFGPVTMLMRNFSLQYWPDKKNLGGRQLNALLKDAKQTGQESFDDTFFANASVAVKGYPAIERMLFDRKVLDQIEQNSSYCPLLEAVSQYVASNTQSITNEWATELTNYADYSEDGVYESASEAAVEILKGLVEPIETISDGKIAAPLGDSLARVRWRKSESWRSEQSIANIASNIASLHHLYSGLSQDTTKVLLQESGAQALANTIEEQFNELSSLLSEIPEPVNLKYQQAQYDQLVMVEDKLKRLSDNLLLAMQALDINLGFNRRDGD